MDALFLSKRFCVTPVSSPSHFHISILVSQRNMGAHLFQPVSEIRGAMNSGPFSCREHPFGREEGFWIFICG